MNSRNPASSRTSTRTLRNSVRSVNYATSPLLASKTPPWRSRFVVGLVFVSFTVLLGRAVHLQILHSDFYQAEGEKRFVHKEPLPASRGRILDRNGLALATSVALPSVQVDTKLFNPDAAQRKTLARLLGMPLQEFTDKLDGATGTVVLRRLVEEPVWAEIKVCDWSSDVCSSDLTACAASTTPPARCWPARRRPGARASW